MHCYVFKHYTLRVDVLDADFWKEGGHVGAVAVLGLGVSVGVFMLDTLRRGSAGDKR